MIVLLNTIVIIRSAERKRCSIATWVEKQIANNQNRNLLKKCILMQLIYIE